MATTDTDATLPTSVEMDVPRRSIRNEIGRFYRPELDALRFGAFLCVFLAHALPFYTSLYLGGRSKLLWQYFQKFRETGNFGVCLFFMLSSYLITELLILEHQQTDSIHLKAFYVRRCLRIWPLYFFILLVAVIGGPFAQFLHITTGELIADSLFFGNWYLMLWPAGMSVLLGLWSISVEEQFYILWPSLAKLGGMRAILIASLVCLPVSWIAIAFVTRRGHDVIQELWFNSLVQFEFFALGALLSIGLRRRPVQLSTKQRWVGLTVALLCWLVASVACGLKDPDRVHTAAGMTLGYLLVGAGCLLFLVSALGVSVRRVPPFIIYLGKISYGLYMFHGFGLHAGTLVRSWMEGALPRNAVTLIALLIFDRGFALALTIALAVLSYRFLESPFLRLKGKFSFVQSRAV